ncbi:hypothetical protein D3C79_624730 [compost metagenome]
MAYRTLLGVDLLTVGQVRLDGGVDLAHSTPGHFIAGLRVVLHPLEIGNHGLHVG